MFGADVTELERGLKRVEYKLGKLSANARRFGSAMTRNVTAPLVGLGALAVREAVKFESAFAKVKKSVGGTEAELKAMEQGIVEMSKTMPTAAEEIARVAASAGQLGIKRQNILGFTKTMIQLGETSNMSADEAADSLARFANITQMSQKNFDRLGSTVVALGNSLATTEKEVVEMGLRLAGAGKQVGMTEAQMLALGGALSSVGIEAQAGGTAFSKLMIEMKLATVKGGDAVKDFATVAGMSVQEFSTLFEQDATGAIIKFIQGLASLEGTGMTAIEVLDKMGITEIRLRDAILRATGASEVFTNAVKLGSEAWRKNNELQEKTAIFYQTTEKRLAILRNNIAATGREIGETLTPSLMVVANRVAALTKSFSELSPEMKTNIVSYGLYAAAIGPVLLAISKLTRSLILTSKALRMFTPGGIVATATVALIAIAESFEGSAEAAAKFNKEINEMDVGKLRELQSLGTGGLFGAEGWKGSIAIASKEQATMKLAKSLEQYDKDSVSRQSGSVIRGTRETPVTAGTQPQVTPEIQAILDTFKKSEEAMKKVGSQGKATKQVFDEMTVSLAKSLGISNEEAQKRIESSKKIGEQTGKEIEALKERQNLMEETRNIALELNQTFASEDAARSLEALRMQLDIGNIGLEQYREALTKIREQFAMFPGAVEQIDSAMTALDISIQASTRTLGSFVREAETALREKFIEVPDLISSAFAGAIAYGEDLGDSLRRLAQDIAYAVIKGTLLKSIFGLFGFADGGGAGVNIVPFANGGIVDRPTIFPMAHGLGLMGEAGPEAVMPLTRTTGGELGVQAEGGGETHITMNINAVDSQSFIQMLRNNKAAVESLVIENIYRNGSVRKAIQQGV
jgi:TP901 family phage tail tape measure protein